MAMTIVPHTVRRGVGRRRMIAYGRVGVSENVQQHGVKVEVTGGHDVDD